MHASLGALHLSTAGQRRWVGAKHTSVLRASFEVSTYTSSGSRPVHTTVRVWLTVCRIAYRAARKETTRPLSLGETRRDFTLVTSETARGVCAKPKTPELTFVTGSPPRTHRHHRRRQEGAKSLSPDPPLPSRYPYRGAAWVRVRDRTVPYTPEDGARRWPRRHGRRTRRAILRDTTDHADPNIQRHARPRSRRSAASSLQSSLPPPHLPVLPHSAITGVAAEIRSSPVLHRKDSSVSRLMRGLIGIQADERTHRYPG